MKRFTFGLLFACVFFSLSALAINSYMPVDQPVDQPVIECDDNGCYPEPGNPLAGRYHLRGRTKKFFGRVA